jgi:cobalt-zinc-cadmium efflux system membrane fusion protein
MSADKAPSEGGIDVSGDPNGSKLRVRALSARTQALIVVSLVVAGAAVVWAIKPQPTGKAADMDTAISSQSKRTRGLFYPSAAQWATLTVEPVQQRVFRSEHMTEGKIAVDEARSTPIFTP